jgi:hypothetical protein
MITHIMNQLEARRAADPTLEAFGAEKHHYRLVEPLPIDAVDTIESRLGVQLPSEYREFLSRVGNGGAGPGYGLERLAVIDGEAQIPKAAKRGPMRVIRSGPSGTFSRPVHLDEHGRELDDFNLDYWDAARQLLADREGPRRKFPCTEPMLELGDDVDERGGSLLLADYGCAIEARLVLEGRYRGHVWMLDGSSGALVPFGMMLGLGSPSNPDEVSDEAFDFLGWYKHWLDAR